MKDSQAFLEQVDKSDLDYPYSRDAYLAALNWQWLIVRGEGAHNVQSTQPDDGYAAPPRELSRLRRLRRGRRAVGARGANASGVS